MSAGMNPGKEFRDSTVEPAVTEFGNAQLTIGSEAEVGDGSGYICVPDAQPAHSEVMEEVLGVRMSTSQMNALAHKTFKLAREFSVVLLPHFEKSLQEYLPEVLPQDVDLDTLVTLVAEQRNYTPQYALEQLDHCFTDMMVIAESLSPGLVDKVAEKVKYVVDLYTQNPS